MQKKMQYIENLEERREIKMSHITFVVQDRRSKTKSFHIPCIKNSLIPPPLFFSIVFFGQER
jgi:hypothetical protein